MKTINLAIALSLFPISNAMAMMEPVQVPEPSIIYLMGAGAVMFAITRFISRKK